MSSTSLRSAAGRLAAAALLAASACGGSGGGSRYAPPVEPRATCPAPSLVTGGTNPAADPGPVCLAAPQPSALAPVSGDVAHGWVDLGEHRVGAVVDLEVPPGTASLLLVEQLVSGGPPGQVTRASFDGGATFVEQPNAAVIGELRDPSGALVYTDLEVISGSEFSGALVTALGAGPVVGSVAYPSTSASLRAIAGGGVASGRWTVMVNDWAHECWLAAQPTPPPGLAGLTCDSASRTDDAVYRLYALTAPAAAGAAGPIPARATLDVAFHLVDAPTPIIGVDAAQAPYHPAVRRMVDSLGWLLSGAGICLGTVTFLDAPGWARQRFATAASSGDPVPCGALPQLLATSRPGERTLELFLVPYLLDDPGAVGHVLGVDGTIPGPATVNGTVASGAVASAEDLLAGTCPAPGSAAAPSPTTCGSDLVAYVAAHEAGHFLGLYHPTEAGGDQFDPLDDTPRCECSGRCGLSASACALGIPASRCLRPDPRCAGGGNLMFWVLGSASVGTLTPEQARLVRTSPLLRLP